MPTREHWQEVQRLVDGALDLPPEARTTFLDRACGSDATLRSEAARLLDACERAAVAGGLFATPPAGQASGLLSALSDRYTMGRELGRGGMATVYLARDLRHDRNVAVKVLEPTVASAGAERFMREIRIAARLTHPHVLSVYDSGEADRRLYYVMPYVDGETLRARLAREGALQISEAVRLLRELADALAYAHGHGVVHRDLKPENVLLSGGHAVVADFGIAKAIAAATEGDQGQSTTLTGTGVALGTPAYMAPEQALGDTTMNHRADLYALGVIAYEMLTGSHPFAGRTAQALAAAHLTETPAPVVQSRPDVPSALGDLVAQLLAKDPQARPQRAGEVLRVLDGLTTGRVTSPSTTRRPARSALLAAVVFALVAVGAIGYWQRHRTGVQAGRATAINTVAVLPFANTSGSRDDDYFSDGLTDELAHALSGISGLRIAGRTASYAFKGKAAAAQEIGRALGVDAFVSATVRRSGDRLRVNPQLVSTVDGTVLSDSVYESSSGDVFAVQDSLTRAVVAALGPALGARAARNAPGGRGAEPMGIEIDVGRGTKDGEAYELYLKGRYHWQARGAKNVSRSIAYFQQAIARDPSFARAYAALALAYVVLPVYIGDPSDSTPPLIKASARRAMTLDSSLADARLATAAALVRDFRFAEAEAHFRAVLRIEPSNQFAHHTFGVMLNTVGRTGDAIAELREATRLDPLAPSAATALAGALIDARRFPEAEAESRRILAIDSTFPLAISTLGLAQAFGGQPDSAVRTLELGVRLYPESIPLRGRLLFAYAAVGRWSDVERMRKELDRPGGDPTGGALPAFADLVLGDRAPLLRLVATRAGQRRWFRLFSSSAAGTGCNPLADPLWADAGYRAAMRDLGMATCPQARPWPLPPRPGA